jgi:serine/threonine-protein kinase RsbW
MLKLPSNLRSINVLDSFVQDVVHQYKISQEVHGNMLISLTEAVTNAITHGNHYDENKVVQINLQKKSDTIAIRVSDQGCGFDPESVPDPTCDENICKCGGRGGQAWVFTRTGGGVVEIDSRSLSFGGDWIDGDSTVP